MAAHHRQGSVAVKTVAVGLTFEKELVGVVQFCAPRTKAMQGAYTRELVRMAFLPDVRVMGGASKMVKHYIKVKKPSDIFTYQSTLGESTDVYEHCGFTKVGQSKKKHYLVAPGKTLATASRREALGLPYVVRYGPDRILGTKLGEVFTEGGGRKTNVELFVDVLGWHLEEASGDRVYAWRSTQVSFYTYKLVATSSSKYYYGVRRINKGQATVADCLADDYWGSGRSHAFVNWRKRHFSHLRKEIMGVYPTKLEAYRAEEKLVGDLWLTDPLCLNSTWGGALGGLTVESTLITVKNCPTHGRGKFIGGKCYRCRRPAPLTLALCPIHGEANHQEGLCLRCKVSAFFTQGECPTHGRTLLRSGHCESCKNQALVREEECPKHGLTKHRGGVCSKCTAAKGVSLRTCPVHGEAVKFQGEECVSCRNSGRLTEAVCPTHGLTTHLGSSCRRCSAQGAVTVKTCKKHGQGKHLGGKCARCQAEKAVSERECPTHGLTKHQGDRCSKCQAAKLYSERECPKHGLTKHRGRTCQLCVGEKVRHARSHKTVTSTSCRYCREAVGGPAPGEASS